MTFTEDDETTVDARPMKRRRVSSNSDGGFNFSNPPSRQIILEEVDLEISLRQRLAETVKSRLTWALLLQESVKRATRGLAETGIYAAAQDALSAIEAPCDVLFTREVRPVKQTQSSQSTPVSKPSAEPLRAPYTSTRTRGLGRTVRAPPKKLLFLRNNTTNPPQIVKLACQDCSRSDFSSLQGLLNHCRLRHQREYGSHDECVQSCALLVEGDEEQAWVVANGTEVAGISLPGLKRLFEIAVGGGRDLLSSLSTRPPQSSIKIEETADIPLPVLNEYIPKDRENSAPASHLTRTLGHHEDTPALAPFLGKEPKRRVINIHDEHVDILSGVHSLPKSSHPPRNWKMHFAHRSEAHSTLTQSADPSQALSGEEIPREASFTPKTIMHATGTRFHISARVSIDDRSLWIPADKRSSLHEEHTHKWRLTVSSPSYSLPLNAFLDKLTISCLSDPPPSTLTEPIILDRPPFTLTSTTDRPFLAGLTFHWAGREGLNASFTAEHWVELDPLHLSTPIVGDEQVFDIELDRNTELFTNREERRSISWDIADNDHPISGDSNSLRNGVDDERTKDGDQKEAEAEDPYITKLRGLLPQFPMTSKDVKGKSPKQVPYQLVPSPAHLKNLIHGRRKAIEWGRARALHEAYAQCEDQGIRNNITLSVADVYAWLSSEGHFPREAVTGKISSRGFKKTTRKLTNVGFNQTTESYCRRCGLHYLLHPSPSDAVRNIKNEAIPVKQEPEEYFTPLAGNHPGRVCILFNGDLTQISRPTFDIRKLLRLSDVKPQEPTEIALPSQPAEVSNFVSPPSPLVATPCHTPLSTRDLVAVADPSLVNALQQISAPWNLCFLNRGTPRDPIPNALTLDTLNYRRAVIEDRLAPYALLAVLAKSMTKVLIDVGLETFREDELYLRTLGKPRVRGMEERLAVRRLLTPSHILRGLEQSGPRPEVDKVRTLTRIMLGSLGVPS